jgi:hypothetical protein
VACFEVPSQLLTGRIEENHGETVRIVSIAAETRIQQILNTASNVTSWANLLDAKSGN